MRNFASLLAAALLLASCGTENPAFRALPGNAALVLEINGADLFDKQIAALKSPAARAFAQTAIAEKLLADLKTAKKIFPEISPVGSALRSKTLAAGLTFNDADSLHALFSLDFGAQTTPAIWLAESPGVLKKYPSKFKGQTIFTVQLAGNERFAVAGIGNTLLFSRLPYLVEDAVTALEKGMGLWQNPAFRKSAKGETAAAGGHRFFVNVESLAEQIGGKMSPLGLPLPEMLRSNLSWLRLDFDGEKIGSTISPEGFLGTFSKWGGAKRGDVFTVLPDNSALCLLAGCGNKTAFFDALHGGETTDFQHFIQSWAGREAAFVLTEPFSGGLAEEQFLVFSIHDKRLAAARLDELSERFGLLKNYDYQTYVIRRLASGQVLVGVVGQANEVFRNPAFARVGNCVVFGHSPAAVELWIDKFIVNQTLANADGFLLLQKQLAPEGVGLVFLNAQHLPALVQSLFWEKTARAIGPFFEGFQKAGMLAGELESDQIGEHKYLAHLKIASQPAPETTDGATSLLWKTPLAAAAATQPFWLENLVDKSPGVSEGPKILIQDIQNEIYCLSENGEIQWRRPVDGLLLGSISGLDFFQNHTRCYLFNTARKLYLLDGEGRDVEGFPLEFKSAATNGVTLTTFGASSDCAFFVACANGNFYGFDPHGRPLPGWNPQPGTGQVAHPLVHFQHGNKDYLVALNRAGTLHVFGRHGDRRFKTPGFFEGRFSAPPQVDAGQKSPRIVCMNTDGKAFVCSLDGHVFSLSLGGDFGVGKTPGFVFAQIFGDSRKDCAALSGTSLTLSGYEGTVFGERAACDFFVKQDTLFEVRMSAAESWLGTRSHAKRQVSLLDGRGRLHPDFPLAGTTAFVVGNGGGGASRVLVVGNGASVYAYNIDL